MCFTSSLLLLLKSSNRRTRVSCSQAGHLVRSTFLQGDRRWQATLW